jgi:hypothetical protein
MTRKVLIDSCCSWLEIPGSVQQHMRRFPAGEYSGPLKILLWLAGRMSSTASGCNPVGPLTMRNGSVSDSSAAN